MQPTTDDVRILFAEFPSRFGSAQWSHDPVSQHTRTTAMLRFVLGQIPTRLGDHHIGRNDLDLLSFDGIGGRLSRPVSIRFRPAGGFDRRPKQTDLDT